MTLRYEESKFLRRDLRQRADCFAYPLIVPAEHNAAAYTEVVSPLMDRMNGKVFQAQTLATLRDTFLPRLISGQLRLPNAEALAATV